MTTLDLPFRGDRNYVHGTDIVSGLSALLPGLFPGQNAYLSSISFHAKATNELVAELGEPGPDSDATAKFVVSGATGTTIGTGWVQQTNRVPPRRVEFDEAAVVGESVIDRAARTLELAPNGQFTTIQVLVAAMKALCYDINRPVNSRWMFGRLDLSCPLPARPGTLRIAITRLFADRYAVGQVTADGGPLGVVHFITEGS
jgi:hypothetical protein